VTDEFVFTVSGSSVSATTRLTFAEAGLWERRDIQEWVIANPAIIGPDVMVVTSELGDFINRKGERDADRLDILGLTRDGTLVVVELKRDGAPHTVAMQALNYAARVSRFDVGRLAAVHARFLTSRGAALSAPEAEARLTQFAPAMTDETLQEVPKVVLIATEFGLEITTTVVFLSGKLGMDVDLVRLSAYRTAGDEIVVTASKTFPPPDIDEFVLFPNAEAEQERKLERKRERNTVARLLASSALADDAQVRFQPSVEMARATQEAVLQWIAEDPRRGTATWRNDASAPLIWDYDGAAYSPTGLALLLAKQVGAEIRSLPGPRFWAVNGKTLPDIAADAETE
jgi:hypothetical protein